LSTTKIVYKIQYKVWNVQVLFHRYL
jgi:hypothetical protein